MVNTREHREEKIKYNSWKVKPKVTSIKDTDSSVVDLKSESCLAVS